MEDAETYAKGINHGAGFYDWLHIGEGLTEWRDAALELTGSQDTDTPAYRAAFAATIPLYPQLASQAGDGSTQCGDGSSAAVAYHQAQRATLLTRRGSPRSKSHETARLCP